MLLLAGWKIHGYIWTELHIAEEVVNQVHKLGVNNDQPEMTDGEPLFEWSDEEPIVDDCTQGIELMEHQLPQDFDKFVGYKNLVLIWART